MTDRHYYVFSYGSNLLLSRIRRRLREVEVAGTYCLQGYELQFNKKGRDGSAKANIIQTGNTGDHVWGVVHKLHLENRQVLDRIEGLGNGYDHHSLAMNLNGYSLEVLAYMATDPRYVGDDEPFCWYHQYVLQGALENGFPDYYVEKIRRRTFRNDPDRTRSDEHWNVLRRVNPTLRPVRT